MIRKDLIPIEGGVKEIEKKKKIASSSLPSTMTFQKKC